MIIRTSKKLRFTSISNDLLEDKGLDWKDVGLLVYLLSKPDSWEVSPAHLMKERKTGRDGIYAILKSLCDSGYASRKPNATGGWDWTIYDCKQHSKPNTEKPNTEKPNTEKPNRDFPYRENPTQVNTEYKTNTEYSISLRENAKSDDLGASLKKDKTAPKGKPKSKDSPIADDFSITEGVLAWYRESGYTEDIRNHFDSFCDKCRARGYEYRNWDAAFKNAIRSDWAGLRKQKFQSVQPSTNSGNTNNGRRGNSTPRFPTQTNFNDISYGEAGDL